MQDLAECKKFKAIIGGLRAGTKRIWVQGLWDSSRAYFISTVLRKLHLPCVVVESGDEESELVYQELETFLPDVEIQLFPAWDMYKSSIEEERATTLAKLLSGNAPPVIVSSIQALLQKVPSPEPLLASTLKIARGNALSMERVAKYLNRHDYERLGEVSRPGEFSLRGGILDVFSPHEENPVRIEFGEETIESIRKFDPETQRSTERREDCSLFPVDGLVREERSTLLAYIPKERIMFLGEPVHIREKAKEVIAIAEEIEKSSLPASGGHVSDYIPYEELVREWSQSTVVYISVLPQETSDMQQEKTYQLPSFSTDECKSCKFDFLVDKLREWMRKKFAIVFYCNNEGEKKRLMELLAEHRVDPDGSVDFRIGHLRGGFVLPDIRSVFLSDQEVFGRYRRRMIRRIRGLPVHRKSELAAGDYVVHIDHGIGKYLGLEKLEVEGRMGEFLTIEYLGGDRLYVPPSHIHLVEKYVGIEGKAPPVYRLGGSSWNLAKRRAVRAIQDMAGELLELHATREVGEGFKFSMDTSWQYEFESAFIYEETPDQLKTVNEIKADMESSKPMDRLVCGDSGYGKTEVAVRSAFKAVMNGKQVAVLVPTTILAEQHYVVFSERMADYPIKIAVLSRFRTLAEQRGIIAELMNGTVDVVIGTHRLLQNDISFRDLGLIIVDEEQRFGVAQKEKLKKLRKTVDVLTMTATPIPRTLYMSLMGIRDISIINTPPENRFPVAGQLINFDRRLLRNAILREIERDGQVFLVHNRVQTIEEIKSMLEELVPEARIEIGHGQMSGKELERVMEDFLAVRIDVLVCTTIIESGLDIPNANTIMINDAPAFGLADLYQLRGRVGRYKHKAYAFFIIPELNPVTVGAKKRLNAIEELSGLGAGFRLAMRDLEIRGAGNLLGREQHGHIVAIGFDLYCKLLREGVRQLRGENVEEFEPTFDLGVEFSIPDSFIPDAKSRIMIYKKMGEIVDLNAANQLKEELHDRFGRLPQGVFGLLKVMELKVKAREVGIGYIGVDTNKIHIRLKSGQSLAYSLSPVSSDGEILDAVEKAIDRN